MKVTFNEAMCINIGAMAATTVALVIGMAGGCNYEATSVQSSVAYPEPQTVGTAGLYESAPLRAWETTVGGCRYVVFRSGISSPNIGVSAVHAGNCTNEIHKPAQPMNFYTPSTVPPNGFWRPYTTITNSFFLTNTPMTAEGLILN